jgi:hypothetical protein
MPPKPADSKSPPAALSIASGSEDDLWFARHPGRSYRCRLAYPAEIVQRLPPYARLIVAVRQLASGVITRRFLKWFGELPPDFDSEAFARQSFKVRRR